MLTDREVLSTINMLRSEHLDVRTVTMGINLFDCASSDFDTFAYKVRSKIFRYAEKLVETCDLVGDRYGIPVVNKRISVSPIGTVGASFSRDEMVAACRVLDESAKEVGVDFIGGFGALVEKGMTPGEKNLIDALPEALAVTDRICSSINVGSTKAGINMDAVAENSLVAQDTVVVQTLHRAAAVVLQAVIDVVHALGDVDVIAGAAVVRCDHTVERLVGDGEQGVAAEHGRQHGVLVLLTLGDKVGVLLNGLQALLLAVPVGDLIAQTGAQAQSLGLLGDGVEGAGNLAIGGVMVEDGGDTLLDGVHVQSRGAGPCAVHHQLAVDGPPRAVQHLIEVGGVVAHDGQTSRQRRVDVGVSVDEGGHDDAAPGIDAVGVGVLLT